MYSSLFHFLNRNSLSKLKYSCFLCVYFKSKIVNLCCDLTGFWCILTVILQPIFSISVHLLSSSKFFYALFDFLFFRNREFFKSEEEIEIDNMPGGGFTKPHKLSADLAAIVGVEKASRAKCVKLLWAYLKANELQVLLTLKYLIKEYLIIYNLRATL